MQRYVDEFTGRQNVRELDTMRQMEMLAEVGTLDRLTYKKLIQDLK